MQVKNYRESKAKGHVTIKKYGDDFQCVKRQFNPDTGRETVPQIASFSQQEIQQQRDQLAVTIADCDALLADLAEVT
mgnify:CR=1 FL=1